MGLLDTYAPGFSWKDVPDGTAIGGVVTTPYREIQAKDFRTRLPLWWPAGGGEPTTVKEAAQLDEKGQPKPVLKGVITVATQLRDPSIPDDDGERAIFIEGDLIRATKEALRRVKARLPEPGGVYWAKLTHREDTGAAQPKKKFQADYKPPTRQPSAEGTILGGPVSAPPAPPQAPTYTAPQQHHVPTPGGVGTPPAGYHSSLQNVGASVTGAPASRGDDEPPF
jgi:hypothetical protein